MKYTYSTTGDVTTYDNAQHVMFAQSMYSQNPTNNTSSPSTSDTWLPSAALFQDDPYYIRNSLLSPNAMKPRVPKDTYPTDKNGLFANAGGSDLFLSNNPSMYKYADADITS